MKAIYATAGIVMLSLGFVGLVVPGLPGTPLFLVAAWLFSMSNERLYKWTTTNRWFGQAVSDYRAGLGIPRRVKVLAVTMIVVALSYSIFFALESLLVKLLVGGLGFYGVWFILTRPTRPDESRVWGAGVLGTRDVDEERPELFAQLNRCAVAISVRVMVSQRVVGVVAERHIRDCETRFAVIAGQLSGIESTDAVQLSVSVVRAPIGAREVLAPTVLSERAGDRESDDGAIRRIPDCYIDYALP